MLYLVLFLFAGIPLAAAVFFLVSLVRYCAARKMERCEPGSVGPEGLKQRKTLLIVSAVIAGVLAAVVIAIVVLFSLATAYM